MSAHSNTTAHILLLVFCIVLMSLLKGQGLVVPTNQRPLFPLLERSIGQSRVFFDGAHLLMAVALHLTQLSVARHVAAH